MLSSFLNFPILPLPTSVVFHTAESLDVHPGKERWDDPGKWASTECLGVGPPRGHSPITNQKPS